MKKLHLKSFVEGMVVTILIGGSTLSYGQSISKNINAFFNNIKIVIDVKEISPMNANGNKIEPSIYNGTTYLPVRSVGEAFCKSVFWDGKT